MCGSEKSALTDGGRELVEMFPFSVWLDVEKKSGMSRCCRERKKKRQEYIYHFRNH